MKYKTYPIFTFFLLLTYCSVGQDIDFKIKADNKVYVRSKWPDLVSLNNLKTISIKFSGSKPENKKYCLYNGTNQILCFVDDTTKEVRLQNWSNYQGKKIDITNDSGEHIKDAQQQEFFFVLPKGPSNGNKDNSKPESINNAPEFWAKKYSHYFKPTAYGFVCPRGGYNPGNLEFSGDNYVHLFFNEYGKPIVSAIPNGIPNVRYVVHILYLETDGNPPKEYFINQSKGNYTGDLNIYGEYRTLSSDSLKEPRTVWHDFTFLLREADNDLEFEIYMLAHDSDNSLKQVNLGTYSIQMTKTYHVGIYAGLLVSNKPNPVYSLLPSANDPNTMVVKRDMVGQRPTLTAMVSFYTSPIILLKRLLTDKATVPDFKLVGRNFLTDNNVLERIYPAVGLSISEKSLSNLFLGLNWEFARGGALFAGWHFTQINSFDEGPNFQYEVTPVTPADFNLRTKHKWDGGFAFGVNIDFKIFKNFIGQ